MTRSAEEIYDNPTELDNTIIEELCEQMEGDINCLVMPEGATDEHVKAAERLLSEPCDCDSADCDQCGPRIAKRVLGVCPECLVKGTHFEGCQTGCAEMYERESKS